MSGSKWCIACGDYPSAYGKPYCVACGEDEGLRLLYANEGLSSYEYTRSFSMIKGRIAETLVEEMFLRLGYSVYRCGMENSFPEVMQYLARDRGHIARHIRKMPDLAIRDQRNDQLLFVEVKFRAEGAFSYEDLGTDYPYDDAYIIVVSRRHIKCLTARELKSGEQILPQTNNYLGSRKEFYEHRQVIVDFCGFATMFFANV